MEMPNSLSLANRLCISAFSVALIVACSGASRVSPLHATIVTVEDTVALQQGGDGPGFTVTAVVRNNDSRVIQVAVCGTEAQREIDGTWTTVFTPACASMGLTPIAAGDSLVLPVQISSFRFSSSTGGGAIIPGRYRLVFGLYAADTSSPTALSVGQAEPSSPFVVK